MKTISQLDKRPKLTLLICSRFSAYLILPRREFGILSRVFHRISKRQRTVSELCLVLGRLKGLTMLDAAHIQRDSLQVESAVGVLLVANEQGLVIAEATRCCPALFWSMFS